MGETESYTQFMGQETSDDDVKKLLKFAEKNLEIFGKLEKKQLERFNLQFKHDEKLEKKDKENRDIQSRRQKDLEDLKEKNYKEELDRTKKQKENLDKLKSFSISDIIPSRIQDVEINKSQEELFSKNEIFLEKMKSTFELIPEKIQKTIKKPQDEKTGEQKNIGEEITRVSFNKEGIQILKILLDPIYKALNANTENLEKLLKKLTEGDKGGSGISSWMWLILGSLVVLFEETYKKFKALKEAYEAIKLKFWQIIEWVKAIPERIEKFLKENKLGKWLEEKWTSIIDSIKDLGRYVKSYWDEFIVNPFKEKWANFMKKAKEFIKFDDLSEAFNSRWTKFIDKIKKFFSYDELIKNLENAGKGVKGYWDTVKGWFSTTKETLGGWWDTAKGIVDSIKSWFAPEGWIGKIFESIKTTFNGLKTTFDDVMKIIEPFINMLKSAGGWVKYLFRFFEWIAVVIDPLVAAGKTLFNVWNNENLNFFEKSIAVLTAAFFGLGDGILSLIDIVSKGVSGVWSFITGNGWKTENGLSNSIEGMNKGDTFGGMGSQMGDAAADLMEKGTGSVALNRIKSIFGMNTSSAKLTPAAEAYTKALEDGNISPEEQEHLDKSFDMNGQSVDDFIMQPKGTSAYIIDKKNNQTYKTSPNDEIIATKKGGIIDKSLQDIKNIMMEVNKNILNINNSNSNPVIVNNNSTSVMDNNESKKYLFKPMYDVNTDKRIAWWKASREYSATA